MATRTFPLFVAGLIAVLFWLFGPSPDFPQIASVWWESLLSEIPGGWFNFSCVAGLVVGLISIVLLRLLTIRHSLIRIYSTFYLTIYVLLSACCLPHRLEAGLLLTCCLLAAIYFFFCSFHSHEPIMQNFQGFFFFGLGSLLLIQLLWLLPFFFCLQARLHMFSLRSFLAALVGVFLPYWFLLGYVALTTDVVSFFSLFLEELLTFYPFVYTDVPLLHWLALAFILVFGLWIYTQYSVQSFQDKIRTRTFIYYLMTVEALLFILAVVQVGYIAILLSPLIALTSILTGHYFAVTRNRGSLISGIVMFVFLVLLFIYESLWMQLSIFF